MTLTVHSVDVKVNPLYHSNTPESLYNILKLTRTPEAWACIKAALSCLFSARSSFISARRTHVPTRTPTPHRSPPHSSPAGLSFVRCFTRLPAGCPAHSGAVHGFGERHAVMTTATMDGWMASEDGSRTASAVNGFVHSWMAAAGSDHAEECGALSRGPHPPPTRPSR